MAHVDQLAVPRASGQHFACSMTSVLVRRVRAFGGEDAVAELLSIARCPHSSAYLEDTANWVSYDLAIALFDAAAQVTGDPHIGRRIGEDTVRQHAGTSVATLLRSLGSPEEVYRHMAKAASKFSTVTEMETIELAPGRALVRAQAREGFERARHQCDWTSGLLSTSTMLFGMPLATVEELECQVDGAPHCLYSIRWDEALAARVADPAQHVTALEAQLVAMTERLESMYATAADLIAGRDLDSTLARITGRAATAVRAPRYLLAVRPSPDAELHFHHRGFSEGEARALAADIIDQPREELPESWLVADVSSRLHRYGRIVALHEDGEGFFPQELQLLQVYARYAATSLDVSTALADSQRGHNEARALLGLSRALADAGTSDEVAGRLADAVPAVVDCDRVGVFVWDDEAGELTCKAVFGHPPEQEERVRELRIRPADTPALAHLLASPESEPLFFDSNARDPFVSGLMRELGGRSMVAVPIAARTHFYGVLTVGVVSNVGRLAPGRELLERLAGVVGHAASALENSRLIDRITDQASHDSLTGLANRAHFAECIEIALQSARDAQRPLGLLYIDLDQFKAVNDEHGHAVGDELLVAVAARLSRTVRREDTVARLGGDEFAVILTAASEEEVKVASGRIAGVFDDPFELAGRSLRVSASTGHAIWPDDEAEIEPLLRHADAAMYRVKRHSRELAAAVAAALD